MDESASPMHGVAQPYRRFEQMLRAPSGEQAGWIDTLAMTLVIVVVVFFAIGLFSFALAFAGPQPTDGALVPGMARELALALVVCGAGFGSGLWIVLASRRRREKLPVGTLISAAIPVRWALMLAAFAVMLCFTAGTLWVSDPASREAVLARLGDYGAGLFLVVMAAYLAGFAIQAGFEEIFVRGWLLQRFCAHGLSVWVAALASSLLFVSLHLSPGIGPTYLLLVLVMGLAYAWSAIRLNGLEFAIGAHVANNLAVGGLYGGFASGAGYQEHDNALVAGSLYLLLVVGLVELFARFWPVRAAIAPLPPFGFRGPRP
jgi:uncharacterized protein